MQKMRYKHCLTWNKARNTQKRGNSKMHTVRPRVWRENGKSWKMRNTEKPEK